jgi:hypothetical protein
MRQRTLKVLVFVEVAVNLFILKLSAAVVGMSIFRKAISITGAANRLL